MRFRLKVERFFTEQIWQHLIVVAFIFTCAWLFDKYAEAVMFCLAHFFVRKPFEKQYHCGTTAICLMTTLTIAFFGIATVLPVSVSLLSTVPICFGISWVGYIAQDRLDLLVVNKKLREASEKSPTDELIARCKAHNYNELKTQMAVRFFILKEKPKDVWLWLCETQDFPMEWDSVKHTKYIMKKELF